MFKIFDGRSKFYQWDQDRMLIVNDPTITEVHFANCLCPSARKCVVYDYWIDDEKFFRVADVPNDLLTEYMDIRVWGYDSGMTKYEQEFQVEKRTKPADYVYTQEEVKTWEQIYEDMSPYRYICEQTANINIGRVPYLPVSLASQKAKLAYIKNNFTLTSPLIWDTQTELKLCIETDYDTIERTVKLKEPAVMWHMSWNDGKILLEYAYKVLDKSKLHLGENGTVYTTFEEQGWEPSRYNSISSNRLVDMDLRNRDGCKLEDGTLTIIINPNATAEENLETINSLDEFIFIYQKYWSYCDWEQICEPIDTVVKHSDDRWFYAYMPGMDEENIRWDCSYYEPLESTLYNLEEKINELGDVEQAISDYLEENPVEVDLSGYATETYVDDAVAGAYDYVNEALSGVDGSCLVFVGPDAPSDPEKTVWIDTDATGPDYQTEAQVKALINEALGVIENGTY